MSEQQDVIAELEDAGVLSGVRWAYLSATARSLETYSDSDGHDAAWLGSTRFTYFRDRLDRVFTCERYTASSGNADLDQLHAELSPRDIAAMPRLTAGLVRRCDLNGSPGWAYHQHRFLLASGTYGKLDRLPWPQKSPTKQRVAEQRHSEAPQASLFEEFADEEVGGLESVLNSGLELDMVTFVVAHSLDPLSQQIELVFGRPQLNAGGGRAWHWRENLLAVPPADGGRRIDDDAPLPTGPNVVPDAPVRLRRPAEEQPRDRTSGER